MFYTKSYAKINLDLYILDKQKNGYHEILTTMLKIDLHDMISLDFDAKVNSILISGLNCESIPTDSSNIALKAAEKYQALCNITERINISIDKKIPTCAGLGGGSSNAAAVLLALNNRYKAMEFADLAKLGTSIGADVPFFMHNADAAICKGIGDVITPIKSGKYYFLLLQGDERISTEDAYSLASPRSRDEKLIAQAQHNNYVLAKYLATQEPEMLAHFVHNDMLESAKMLAPSIMSKLEELDSTEPMFSSMSGSGSVCFACYKDLQSAIHAQKKLDTNYWSCVCETIYV